jgi:predicted nucleic acid-binding protein
MLDLAELGLRRGDLVILDAAPIIYLVEGDAVPAGRAAVRRSERNGVARFFADAAREGNLRLAASTVAWTEVLAGPLAEGDGEKAASFRRALADWRLLTLEPVDVAIAEEAARLSALPVRPGFADAIHLATAAVLGAAAVLTNDDAWPAAVAAAGSGASPHAAAYRSLRVLLVDELAFEL